MRSVGCGPRRSVCAGCRRTHVLLPASVLLRRADAVDVIGRVGAAARRRLGTDTAVVVGGWSPWQLASALTAGRLLAPAGAAGAGNTSWPWAGSG